MRPHNIQPAREITQLALSPDGQRFGVVQGYHGFRAYDALTGAEVGPEPEPGYEPGYSPTGRHFLSALRSQVRLAELAAGLSWKPFQTGWTREGDWNSPINRPPSTPETLALPAAPHPATASIGARLFDRWGRAPRPAAGQEWAILIGALSADHRLAVGRFLLEGPKLAVCDLACESLATNLDMSAAPAGSEYVRPAFSADGRRVFAAAYAALFVFDLPPVGLAAIDLPVEAPVLKPTLVIPVTQPQPETSLVPPFAVLPCGTKILLRGAKSRVELRDLATGELLTAWQWLRKVTALAVAADGLTAAAGGASGRVVIWDLG